MAPQREILDSEDDGSEFGGGSDFGDATVPAEPEMPLLDNHEPHDLVEVDATLDMDASHHAGTDSTDPSFFQRIYDRQQAAVAMPDMIPDTAPVDPSTWTGSDLSSAPPLGKKQKNQAKNQSSLTFITDPMPASRKSKRTREATQTEVIDLTDLTPPRNEAAGDVWDVPTSARSQRATRTYGNRKLAQLSLEQDSIPHSMPDTQDPYAFPDSTPPVKKTTGHSTPSNSAQQALQSSPVMLVPTGETFSSDRRTGSSRKKKASLGEESSMPDTAAPSLYVTQSILTASQKQEYRMVSLSSDADASEMLPPDQSFGADMYKSSGASTVAYPTPSRVASSRRMVEITEELDGNGFEASPVQDVYHQQSSPDVLADMATTAASTAKRSRIKIVSSKALDSAGLENPSSTRRAKKRKVVQEAADEPWGLDPLGGTQENNDCEIRDAEGTAAQQEAHTINQAQTHSAEPTSVEPLQAPTSTAKGKRGRKKKVSKPDESMSNFTEQPLAEVNPSPAEPTEPPTKRKRGRPRKSEPDPQFTKTQIQPTDDEAEQSPTNNKQAETEAEPHTTPQPLSQIHPNPQPNSEAAIANGGDSGEAGKENDALELDAAVKDTAADSGGKTKEKKEKEKQGAIKDVKTGGGQKPAVVQYRVGLSKRSRIAPLLKSLKKPV